VLIKHIRHQTLRKSYPIFNVARLLHAASAQRAVNRLTQRAWHRCHLARRFLASKRDTLVTFPISGGLGGV